MTKSNKVRALAISLIQEDDWLRQQAEAVKNDLVEYCEAYYEISELKELGISEIYEQMRFNAIEDSESRKND